MDLYRFVNEKTNFNVVEEDKLKWKESTK
jgi:hypothetical protein